MLREEIMKSYDLNDLLRRAYQLAGDENWGIGDVAGTALALAACREQIDKALEPLKEILREDARAEQEKPDDVVEFDGVGTVNGVFKRHAGTISITFQGPRPKVNKGVHVADIRRLLGPDFDEYFEITETVVPRRDFVEQCEARNEDHPVEVTAALTFVEVVDPTPRVGFHPSRAVTPGGLT